MLQCAAVCCSVLQCSIVIDVSMVRLQNTTAIRECQVVKYIPVMNVCCSVLQCVAVCCSVLQCSNVTDIPVMIFKDTTGICERYILCLTTGRCGCLHCAVVCCNVSWCVALCCSVLQCVAVCCSVQMSNTFL